MENTRGKNRNKALSVTFCGVMAAVGVVLMLVGAMFGVLTYAAPLMASVCLIPVYTEFGKGRAWLCYLATAIIAVLLSPDKELAFFYVFIGYYPLVRQGFLRIGNRVLRVLVKLMFFAAVIAALYAFLYFVMQLEAIMKDLKESGAVMNALFFAGMTVVLLIYDKAVELSERLYVFRIRPKLRFLPK